MYKFAIGCVFRDSAFYLKEWIEYHLLIGVEHFYLVNHLSIDHYMEILEPYIRKNIVELINEDKEFQSNFESEIHCPNMNKIIKMAKNKVEWLALLDSDEFITAITNEKDTKKYIYNLLDECKKKHKNMGGLALNWCMYGSGNIDRLENNQYILEKMNRRTHLDAQVNRHIKCLIIPNITKKYNTHNCTYVNGYHTFDIDGNIVNSPFTVKPFLDKLRLNHYCIGDKEYFNSIKVPFYKRYLKTNEHPVLERANNGEYNEEIDNYMMKFVVTLKEKLKNVNLLHHKKIKS